MTLLRKLRLTTLKLSLAKIEHDDQVSRVGKYRVYLIQQRLLLGPPELRGDDAPAIAEILAVTEETAKAVSLDREEMRLPIRSTGSRGKKKG